MSKTLQDYVQERTGRGKIVKKYKVPSKSEPNSYHIVEVDENNKYFCDCVASMYKRDCSHIKMAKLWKK